jgi:predicted amidohydrolase
MIVSPRGQVLAEAATAGTEILGHTIDLAGPRDGYLSQQRADLVTVTYRSPLG